MRGPVASATVALSLLAAAPALGAGRIVYDGNCSGTIGGVAARGGICVMPDDGSAAPRLVLQFGDFPRWSPDGTRFAYQTTNNTSVTPPGGFQIAVANADGSGAHNLTTDGGDTAQNTTPAWSPDGRQIVFDRQLVGGGRVTTAQITVMNADGSGRRIVFSGGYLPQFSADGSRIVFVRNGDVYSIGLDGTGLRALTLGGALSGAVPSPDGRRYALTVPHGSLSDIWSMNTDGTGLRRITPTGAWTFPAWSSDGAGLIADRQSTPGSDSAVDLYRFDLSGSPPVRLTASTGFLDSTMFPDWWVPGRPTVPSAPEPAAPVPIVFAPAPVALGSTGASAAAVPRISARRRALSVAALSRTGGKTLQIAVVRGGGRPRFRDARTAHQQAHVFHSLRRGTYRLLVRTRSRTGRAATRRATLRITG